ncbi:hypothetical protein Tco_0149989 [Tanacetum coccineum]
MASDHISSDPVPQCPTTVLEQDSLSPGPQSQENVPQAAETVTTSNELDLLFSLMFDELLNGTTLVVSKSSAVHAADDPNKRQQHNTTQSSTTTVAADAPPLNIQTTPQTTNQAPTQVPTVTATENIIQAETNNEYAQVDDDEFVNVFSTPVQERGETSSRHVDSSNMHTFYQHHPSGHRWTKDHPLEQVIGNPSQSIRTRRQLETDGKMSKGYAQKEGIDFEVSFAPVAWLEAVWIFNAVGTLIATKPLDADLSGTPVDQTKYRSMVRALMYLTASRPDIVHATCYCARYQPKPTEKHLTAVKRTFRYLKDTINMGLWYPRDIAFELTAFSDSDHAGCLDSRKSTSGGIQRILFSNHKVSIIGVLDLSKAAIAISCNPVQHSRTKHINVSYHFIKEQVEKGIVELFFVGTEYQLADLFTKALPEDRFKYLVRRRDV